MQNNAEPNPRFRISVIREPACTPMTPRKREVCWDFGIPPREAPFTVADNLTITLRSGGIVALVGPSGSGKSSILAAIAEQAKPVIWTGRGRFPTRGTVVDAVAPRKPLATALKILTACGLGEPRLWVRRFDDLSDGERFRAGLARAVGQSLTDGPRQAILCDEFTAILHRRAAKAVAYNLRKLVTREGLTLVVATTHDDIIDDLQPDQIIRLGGQQPVVIEQPVRDRPISLQRRAAITGGSVTDYRTFSPMHYRHRDGLGFVDKVFLLKEGDGGDPLGILVFAHAPLELALRNLHTAGRFVRNPRRLNRELRILRRLVMHPDVRGCGLGHWFVKETLPRVGVRFVECLAAMGAVNPVFEQAGMRRVGRCPLPRGRMELLHRLQEWSIDPFAEDFAEKIARLPRVRRLVERTIHDWVSRTQGAHQLRVDGRSPAVLARTFRQVIGEPPLYYLWDKLGEYPTPDDRPSPSDDRPSPPAANPSRPDANPADCRPRPRVMPDKTSPSTDRHRPDRPPGSRLRTRDRDATAPE